MTFVLNVARDDGSNLGVSVAPGDVLFVLGANGTGKSSLMHRLYRQHMSMAKRISAHRQTWFHSNDLELSPMARRNSENNIRANDKSTQARYREQYPNERASIALYDVVDAENVRARDIAAAVDLDNLELARQLSQRDAPLKIINSLLRLSNIPIEVWIERNEQVRARKEGGEPYGIAELSDGERNALIIAATVLTAPPGSLFLIDEPERHLHRSIISPLLTALFAERGDCAFVVSTHDLLLPLDNPSAQNLLVRSCRYEGDVVSSWEADLLPGDAPLDDRVKEDIVGARRRILFVEGAESSLDRPLYGIVFPEVSIVPKESCRDVEQAVRGISGAQSLHWLTAWGIVDGDGRSNEERSKLKEEGIFALPFYSVEAVYYHPAVMRLVAERTASVTGDDPTTKFDEAVAAALASLTAAHISHLATRAAEKSVRAHIFSGLPTRQSVSEGQPVDIHVDVASELVAETQQLTDALANGDILKVMSAYPARETPMLGVLAAKLGFRGRSDYEKAVRKLLIDEPDALQLVRSFFEDLPDAITPPPEAASGPEPTEALASEEIAVTGK